MKNKLLVCLCLQLHGPTGVTHCVSAFLTHPAGAAAATPNLVVARSTALDVYTIK